jgi:Holliday junction resolvase RusA-like endonuclease
VVTEPSPQPLRFVVFGRPQQKGSKRALPIRGRAPAGHHIVLVDANRNAAPWAGRVAAEAIRAYGPQRELQRTPVAVFMRFYFSRPRGHFGMGRNASRVKASAPDHMGVMPDIDKLARCALDALTGTVLKDDALVSELSLAKRWGEPERLEVEVLAL